MPDATITSTASTFGTITGTFAADQSTVTGTITGTVAGTLTGSVGVPGPAGPGVPAGGTAGQYLQKIDGVDYNTDWVTLNLSAYAPLNSPAFTGDPTAPTPTFGDNDTSIATTAFVQAGLLGGTANAKNLEVYVRNQSGSSIPAGSIVYISGATGNKPLITLAQANNDANSAQTMGFTKTAIANNGFGYVIVRGELENIDTSALTEGAQLYLSPTVAGTWTTTKPSAPQHLVYVGIVVRAHPTQGIILVAVQNGYELNELHDVAITSPTNGQVLKYNSSTNLWVNDTDVGGVAWGGITGTLSSQTDLQTALDGKYSTSNPAGYITSAALTGYATESFVTSQGYITSAALTPYLTSATAASTYQTLAGMSSYLTTATAASTYAPIASPTFTGTVTIPGGASISGYLTTSSAASTYAALAGATFTGVVGFDGSSGIAAKSIGSFKSYASGLEATDYSQQFNTGFQVVASGTTIARLSASGLLLPSGGITFNDATTQSTAGISAATAAATYAPLASPALTGNPTAPTPATADDDTSIATTAFVKAQGYLTTAPVTSVAGKTGAVTLVVGDVSGAAPTASPTLTGTPLSTTAAVDTNTTQIATTAFVVGQAGSASPVMDGAATVGTSLRYARQDHVHPTDTSRAPLASPALTGTPTAPTASTGTNTTQIATTAFVQQEVPDFATTSEIMSPSSTTKVLSPFDAVRMITNRAFFDTMAATGSFNTSGTGAEAYKVTNDRLLALGTPNVGIAGHGQNMFDTTASSWGLLAAKRGAFHYTQDWSKKIFASGTTMFNLIGDSATTARVMIGGKAAFGTGSPTKQSIGWKLVGGGSNALVLVTYGYNGTSSVVTETTSSFTPVVNQAFDWFIYHEPNVSTPSLSKCYLYVNDTLVATGINSPADATITFNYFLQGCESTGSHATRMAYYAFPTKIWWSRS